MPFVSSRQVKEVTGSNSILFAASRGEREWQTAIAVADSNPELVRDLAV
jgi:hypothetical protein